MKIKGQEWMVWLHEVRRESAKQQKRGRRSLATHLKTLERKTISKGRELSDLARTSGDRVRST